MTATYSRSNASRERSRYPQLPIPRWLFSVQPITGLLSITLLSACNDDTADPPGVDLDPPSSLPDDGHAVLHDDNPMVLTEVVYDDGGLPAIDLSSLTSPVFGRSYAYPLTIIKKDQDGNTLGERIIANEEQALDDLALTAAEVRAEIINSNDDLPLYEQTISWFQKSLDNSSPGDEGRDFIIAVLRGLEH